LLVLLLALGAIAVPAGALRAACAGRSCAADDTPARVPFCPLPEWLRADLAAGYREDRSPDVLGVARRGGLSALGPEAATWPSVADGPDVTRVPLAFWGAGVRASAVVPVGTTLDAVAPTVAEAIGLHRAHPDVRSGVAVPGVAAGRPPSLVVEIVLEGIGARDVGSEPSAWPTLTRLVRAGAGTMSADTGSLPLDPAAILTTIGTGGLPDQHGITGSVIRGDDGGVVRAWSRSAPPSVIATLADDLDDPGGPTGTTARIGLLAPSTTDLGLIGGNWYPDGDRDDVVTLGGGRGETVLAAVRSVLDRGYGADRVPDVLGIVLDGRSPGADRLLGAIVAAGIRASGDSTMVAVTATGSTERTVTGVDAAVSRIEDEVPGDRSVVSAVAAGGLFLDRNVMASERVSGQAVVDALLAVDGDDGEPLMLDAFQGFAVSFARYC
jgi:hypothetical protein